MVVITIKTEDSNMTVKQKKILKIYETCLTLVFVLIDLVVAATKHRSDNDGKKREKEKNEAVNLKYFYIS